MCQNKPNSIISYNRVHLKKSLVFTRAFSKVKTSRRDMAMRLHRTLVTAAVPQEKL